MRIKLNTIYSQDDLDDDSEKLFHHLPDNYQNGTFSVNDLDQDDLKKLIDVVEGIPILTMYELKATEEQKEIVRYYQKFLRTGGRVNPIVTEGLKIIDGNHRAVAALLSKMSIPQIDLQSFLLDKN